MKYIITDDELAAYAEGTLSDAESRALEKKAIETGQTDLLLSVVIAQSAIDKELVEEYWGTDSSCDQWKSKPSYRAAAFIDEEMMKKNNSKD
jgi:hypothetical protein